MEEVTKKRQQKKKKDLEAKRKVKSGVYVANRKAQAEIFSQLEGSDSKNFIFELAKRMKRKNQDIVDSKCVKNYEGYLTYNDSAKLKAWKSHYERLLNVEFMWNGNSLPILNLKIGPPLY